MKIFEEFQIIKQEIETLEAKVQDLNYKLKCRDDELAEARSQIENYKLSENEGNEIIAELKAQNEKMKRCFNCAKWFSNTELCVSNERGASICDKWEPAE